MNKVLLDTNVILEAILGRALESNARKLFDAIDSGTVKGYLTAGSLYTITYKVERYLKQRQAGFQERLELQRKILMSLTEQLTVIPSDNEMFRYGICDTRFSDFEDSFQYQAAVSARCDTLVTINISDYKDVHGPVTVVGLSEI